MQRPGRPDLPRHAVIPGCAALQTFTFKLFFGGKNMNWIALNAESPGVIRDENGVPVEWTLLKTGSNPICREGKDGSLVLSGKAMDQIIGYHAKKGELIPVDSEHSAIFQLLRDKNRSELSRIIITASGGPFRNRPLEELDEITPEVAANHPTWSMGPKISIDSSTLANKGLEVIEAHYLFGFDADHIEVVIHPQSIVHSMVRTRSGQVYAQMSPPDMVFPIMRALLWPEIDRQVGKSLDFTNLDLTFRALDPVRFPFVPDAFECVRLEGSYPIVYNTANEVAVDRFRKGMIRYTQIHDMVRKTLDKDWSYSPSSLQDILDIQARVFSMMEG